jgi:hypothetical protein
MRRLPLPSPLPIGHDGGAMRIRALPACALPLSCALLVAGCAAPPPKTAPLPPPLAAIPVLPAPPADWRDLPLAPGAWSWSAGRARYGEAGATPLLTLSCENGAISIAARGTLAAGGETRIAFNTSDGDFGYAAAPGEAGTIVARVAASDSNLDKIAFSRGRFAISAPAAGLQRTLLPTRPEPARVINDCRG